MDMIDRDQFAATVRANREYLHALGVRRLGVFGSVVRGENRPDSDIDVLVEFESGKKRVRAFIALGDFLEERLNTKVDLVSADGLSPFIGPHILKEVSYVTLTP